MTSLISIHWQSFSGSWQIPRTKVWFVLKMCSLAGKYEIPFSEYTHLKIDYQIFFHASQKELRPTLPRASQGPFNNLIKQMWSPKPEERPSAQQILDALEQMKEEYRDDVSSQS